MNKRPVIRVKYCGGCNPEIDRAQVLQKVKILLGDRVRFDRRADADLALLINGCPHACLDEENANPSEPMWVSIQGRRVDCRIAPGEDPSEAAAARICEILNLPADCGKEGERSLP